MVDSMDSMERDVRRAYNDLAGTYFNFRVTGKAVYNEYLEMPTMLAELGNVRGKHLYKSFPLYYTISGCKGERIRHFRDTAAGKSPCLIILCFSF